MKQHKETNALLARLKAAGIDVEMTNNGRWCIKPPNGGAVVIISARPKDRRALQNNLARLRRHGVAV